MESAPQARSSLKSASSPRGRSSTKSRGSVKFSDPAPSETQPAAARSPSPKAKDVKPAETAGSPRRSSPTKLFSEEDFERKRDAPDAEKRKKMAAKARGLAIDPKDWSRAELLERLNRFCRFTQEQSSGVAELKMKEGFSLSTDEVKVLCELFRRINDIQVIDMTSCGATDDHIQVIVNEGFKNLRHLKQLYLGRNQLSSSSITTLCSHFPRLHKKLEVLDLRENSAMSFDDGSRIYHALPSIGMLNGLPIQVFRSDEESRANYDFSSKDMRIMELGIVCGLVAHMSGIKAVNLRSNKLTAKGMHHLLDTVKKYQRLKSIDVSFNPITNDGADLSAVERLRQLVQQRTHLTEVRLEGVVMPDALRESIELSLMVNRSVDGTADGYHFNRFAEKLILSKAKPKSRSQIEEWEPRLDEVDEGFIRGNRLPVCALVADRTGFGLAWREQPREFL